MIAAVILNALLHVVLTLHLLVGLEVSIPSFMLQIYLFRRRLLVFDKFANPACGRTSSPQMRRR